MRQKRVLDLAWSLAGKTPKERMAIVRAQHKARMAQRRKQRRRSEESTKKVLDRVYAIVSKLEGYERIKVLRALIVFFGGEIGAGR